MARNAQGKVTIRGGFLRNRTEFLASCDERAKNSGEFQGIGDGFLAGDDEKVTRREEFLNRGSEWAEIPSEWLGHEKGAEVVRAFLIGMEVESQRPTLTYSKPSSRMVSGL